MSTHKRTSIRSAVVDLLIAASTGAGSAVFGNRATPIWDETLPIILVFAREETSVSHQLGDSKLRRKLTLVVEGRVEANTSLEDALDSLAYDIEAAMRAAPRFGLDDDVADSVLTGTTLELSAAGEKPIGAVSLTYEVLYFA